MPYHYDRQCHHNQTNQTLGPLATSTCRSRCLTSRRGIFLRAAAAYGTILTLVLPGAATLAQSPPRTVLKTVIQVPNVTATTGFFYDGSYVDVPRRLYYLGNRTTRGIDIVDITSRTVVAQISGIFVGQLLTGQKLNNSISGPNALAMIGQDELWVGDGDSTIKIIDLNRRAHVATISTGGNARTDFVVYDPDHHLVLATNKNDNPPFITFIDARTRKVLEKVPVAAKQVDGVVYDLDQHRYLMSVGPTIENPHGGVAVIDPVSHAIIARYPTPECYPAGLALGPSARLLVGCSDDAIAAGFEAKTLIMDASSGKILRTITQVGGSNYVTYNPGNKRFYLGARDMTVDGRKGSEKAPYLGVIDAMTMQFIENVPAAPNCKTVVADPITNLVFMPLTASANGPGIGVFSD